MPRFSPASLEELLSSGEGQTVEFKDERIKPSDLAETLVAFANSEGGTVILGIADDGRVVGVSDSQRAQDLAYIAASRDCCDPPIVLGGIDQIKSTSGKTVIAVRVPRSRTTVHSAQGRFLRRQGSHNVAIDSAALRRLLIVRGGLFPLTIKSARREQALHSQTYEVLRHQQTLTLLDPEGKQAVWERRERVRFLQDNVIAIYDHLWGDGRLFKSYRVSPGRVADRFQTGSRYQTLISLRDTKQRGDILTYRIRQRIVDGFTAGEEWLENAIDHPTRYLELNIIFPVDRPCRQATVIETSTNKRSALAAQSLKKRKDGSQCLCWSIRNPVFGECYAIQWNW